MPPVKTNRRTIRHLRDGLDQLGALEQSNGRHRAETVLLTMAARGNLLARRMRRHRRHRVFRDVRVLRHEPRYAAKSKARAEPVDQMREFLGVVADPASPGLHRIAAFGDQRREPHHVVAEARIAGVAEDGEPLLEQFADARRIAQRRAGADLEPVHLAVGAEQRHLKQAARPRRAAPAQRRAGAPDARWCRARRLSRAIGSGNRCSAMAAGTGSRGVIGSSTSAQRLIETEQQFLAEARREWRARPRWRDRRRRSGPAVFSSATVSASTRSAAIGSGSTAASVSPRGTMPGLP